MNGRSPSRIGGGQHRDAFHPDPAGCDITSRASSSSSSSPVVYRTEVIKIRYGDDNDDDSGSDGDRDDYHPCEEFICCAWLFRDPRSGPWKKFWRRRSIKRRVVVVAVAVAASTSARLALRPTAVAKPSAKIRLPGVWGGVTTNAAPLWSPEYSYVGEIATLPRALEDNLADVTSPVLGSDVPLLFHVPRSGGSTLKDILGSCAGAVTASDVGARRPSVGDGRLGVVRYPDEDGGSLFVNVDVSTPPGILRAKELRLAESGLAELISTQHLREIAELFDPSHRGRMFTFLRHPVDRAVSLFHYLASAEWEPTYNPALSRLSLEMYARSTLAEENWMVRFLSGASDGVATLTSRHLELAKEVLRRKCLVGLLDEKSESWGRIERYFGWDERFDSPESRECQHRLLDYDWSNKHAHERVEEGSDAWRLLSERNDLDVKLYEYARKLFAEQAKIFH